MLALDIWGDDSIPSVRNAQTLTIDGVEYKRGVAVEKNNDQGNMWIINSQLLRICDDISFTCE